MKLTKENYHSTEASMEFIGSSQIKNFMECEYKGLQMAKGLFKLESDSLTQGGYIDAHFDKELDLFIAKHPEMCKKDGSLYAKFEFINDVINAIEHDPILLNLFQGGISQQIFTGEIEGCKVKIMIDNMLPEKTVDRKFMKDFKDVWDDGEYVAWWKKYRYDIQAALYQEVRSQATKEPKLPFEIAAVSKEKITDKKWLRFSQETMNLAMDEIRYWIPRIKAIKDGLIEPKNCGVCEVCRAEKMLEEPEEV